MIRQSSIITFVMVLGRPKSVLPSCDFPCRKIQDILNLYFVAYVSAILWCFKSFFLISVYICLCLCICIYCDLVLGRDELYLVVFFQF